MMPLTIHLSHGSHKVVRVFEADEAVASRLVALLVSDDARLDEGRVALERPAQRLVRHRIAKVTAEDPEVV